MDEDTRRISLVIREDQYQKLSGGNVNVSGLIRDLIDDHYSRHSITINVSDETRDLYDELVSHADGGDKEIEPYLRQALQNMLKDKIKKMEKLQRALEK
jgi:hypothetical protein